jgi:uncharacterized protein (UPF0332 family)
MEEPERRAIIAHRLARSREELKYSRLLIDEGAYRIATSRLYYAVFTLATATLLTQDVVRHKHAGVLAAFNEFLVKPGLIEPEFGAIFHKAFKSRQEADYSDSGEFTEEEVRRTLADAERFVERVEGYLRTAGFILDLDAHRS